MARSILIPELPRFVPPMLAKPGVPFDSSEHLFEIKWDGTRVLAFVDSHGYRLVNRHRAEVTHRFPEFGFLKRLPAGALLARVGWCCLPGDTVFSLVSCRRHSA